jgi:hypothetical protein
MAIAEIAEQVKSLFERILGAAVEANTSRSWGDAIAQLEKEVEERRIRLREASERLEGELIGLTARGDQVGLAALQKAERDAREKLEESQRLVSRATSARDAAMQAEELAASEERWKRAEALGAQFQNAGEDLQSAIDQFVACYERVGKCGLAFYRALPCVPDHLPTVLDPGGLFRLVELYKFGRAGELFPRPRGGIFSSHQIAQGPDLRRRFSESIAHALQHRPRTHTQPPPAA